MRDRVLTSPISWDSWGTGDAIELLGQPVPVAEELAELVPLPYDVDGDGGVDPLGVWLVDRGELEQVVAPITGGLAGLRAFDAERAWEVDLGGGVVPYVDQGRLHVLIEHDGGWRDADVGPVH